LNIGDYEPKIRELTRPYLEAYAIKCGMEICEITERKFPEWPVTYEKLQIYELGKDNDWNLYVDSDALIHPDLIDFTEILDKDTVFFYGKDFWSQRWRYDKYARRDGRHISACTWFVLCSDWTIDLWRPNEDLGPEEAIRNIKPVQVEINYAKYMGESMKGYATHLIDDYTLSRNIAKFGLKHKTVNEINEELKLNQHPYFAHIYLDDPETKYEFLMDHHQAWKNMSGSVIARENR
jgi:hypothetical protein